MSENQKTQLSYISARDLGQAIIDDFHNFHEIPESSRSAIMWMLDRGTMDWNIIKEQMAEDHAQFICHLALQYCRMLECMLSGQMPIFPTKKTRLTPNKN